jgi:uncharacterized membrane protein
MSEYLTSLLFHFSLLDGIAFGILLLSWLGSGFIIEKPNLKRPSTHTIMVRYRYMWMAQMVTREPRVFDATILGTLRQGTTFFASACMITIGGGVALLGQIDQLQIIATNISPALEAPAVVWQARVMLVILLLANGFLKFVWAHRLFGYCAIVMASVPNKADDAQCLPMAERAARLSNYASKSYNRGLRAVYFSFAALAWLFGAEVFLVATLVTVWILYRREFASQSRAALLHE